MTYDEIQEVLRLALKAAPRGFQKHLVATLDRDQREITQWYTGHRKIPADMIDAVAKELGLTLELVAVKGKSHE